MGGGCGWAGFRFLLHFLVYPHSRSATCFGLPPSLYLCRFDQHIWHCGFCTAVSAATLIGTRSFSFAFLVGGDGACGRGAERALRSKGLVVDPVTSEKLLAWWRLVCEHSREVARCTVGPWRTFPDTTPGCCSEPYAARIRVVTRVWLCRHVTPGAVGAGQTVGLARKRPSATRVRRRGARRQGRLARGGPRWSGTARGRGARAGRDRLQVAGQLTPHLGPSSRK